jgi:hypothetical protein
MVESQSTRAAMQRVDFPRDAAFADAQAALVLPDWQGLQPSTEVYQDARLLWRTNSLGLRGPEPDPTRKLAVIWGDSVIFGAPDICTPWLPHLDTPACQVLNGGVPGCPLHSSLERMNRLDEVLGIDLHIVFAGWNYSTQEGGPCNAGLKGHLLYELWEYRGRCALVTTPTSLNPAIVDHDLRAFAEPWAERFVWDFEPGVARAWLDNVIERNQIIREVGDELGLPVFDWYEAMRTTSLEDFRTDFVDFGHFRSAAMPKVVAAWNAWLRRAVSAPRHIEGQAKPRPAPTSTAARRTL